MVVCKAMEVRREGFCRGSYGMKSEALAWRYFSTAGSQTLMMLLPRMVIYIKDLALIWCLILGSWIGMWSGYPNTKIFLGGACLSYHSTAGGFLVAV